MARPARIDVQGYHYHVISRGQRKNPIFFSPEDRRKYFQILNKLLVETDIDIYSYCLMTNHVHFDIFRNEYPLQLFMKRLNTNYALYFNKKYRLVGHVFQGRYVSRIVLDDIYLMHLAKYIHLNPEKAGIVKSPNEYKYSSAKFYNGKKEENLVLIKKVPAFMKVEKYVAFMNSEDTEYPVYRDCIGNQEDYLFLEKRMFDRKKSTFTKKRLSERNIFIDAKTIAEEFGSDIEKILSYKWDRSKKEIKYKVIKKLVEQSYNYSEIARFFGYSKSAIGKILKKEF